MAFNRKPIHRQPRAHSYSLKKQMEDEHMLEKKKMSQKEIAKIMLDLFNMDFSEINKDDKTDVEQSGILNKEISSLGEENLRTLEKTVSQLTERMLTIMIDNGKIKKNFDETIDRYYLIKSAIIMELKNSELPLDNDD